VITRNAFKPNELLLPKLPQSFAMLFPEQKSAGMKEDHILYLALDEVCHKINIYFEGLLNKMNTFGVSADCL
jgi:hypothetical protein